MKAGDQIGLDRLVRSVRTTITKALAGVPDIVTGRVTQVSPLLVLMNDGSVTPAPAYAIHSYITKTVGDQVLVHKVRGELYVAGKVA